MTVLLWLYIIYLGIHLHDDNNHWYDATTVYEYSIKYATIVTFMSLYAYLIMLLSVIYQKSVAEHVNV